MQMNEFTNIEFGAHFEDAYECTHPQIDRILNAFGEPHSANVIHQDNRIKISRLLTQTGIGILRSYKIMFIANLTGTIRFIITCGSITTCQDDKIPEYEKIGKRKLYKAICQFWNIQF